MTASRALLHIVGMGQASSCYDTCRVGLSVVALEPDWGVTGRGLDARIYVKGAHTRFAFRTKHAGVAR